MSFRVALAATAFALSIGASCPSARADANGKKAPALSGYLGALREKHLLQADTAKVEELRATLAKGEALALAGRNEDAVVLLYELVESPRFSDYAELEEMSAARFALGSALHALGAEQSARHYLRSVIDQGPDSSYFAPAFRAHTDVALSGEPLAPLIAELDALKLSLPEDAQNELRYLRAREHFDAGDDTLATLSFSAITPRSRFYANAQYLLGSMAARAKQYRSAETHFCKIATGGDGGRYSFYVDGRYFHVKDLARLGLGRVAHEEHRSEDAFYYYFQVPQDSPHLPEAMFEAAYATYEGGDHETALDLLDQLEARFPGSSSADEASILRGYSALSNCDFEKARKMFSLFIKHFGPLEEEIARILENPARRAELYQELARADDPALQTPASRKQLLALLHVDPIFSDLHERVRKLDAEAARAGRVPDVMDAIAARLAGSDAPKPTGGALAVDELVALKSEATDLHAALALQNGQLDAMRNLGAKKAALAPLEKELAALARRANALDAHIADARFARMTAGAPAPDLEAPTVDALFTQDVAFARGFERRVAELRPQLLTAANARALSELTALQERLRGFLRRARIGRIDAIMGSKRRIELQIESLSAGRLPAGMSNPLRVQGFLADDEEYWPFEGEDWPDEYIENYGDRQKPKSAAPAGAK